MTVVRVWGGQWWQDGGLPLYAEDWLEELMGRIFTLLTNLDSPEVRSDLSATGPRSIDNDCQSFLLHDNCMYRYSMALTTPNPTHPPVHCDSLVVMTAHSALSSAIAAV